MKILFICSGKQNGQPSTIVYNQLMSLKNMGLDISTYIIEEKGITGYTKHIFKLRNLLHEEDFDVIHAHYSFSGFLASLAGAKPTIVSLMGSDTQKSGILKQLALFFSKALWREVIVKSEKMKNEIGLDHAHILPNGVNFSKFKPLDRNLSLSITGWDSTKKHVLFAASPNRAEKNFLLAKMAFESLEMNNCELHVLIDIPNDQIPYYYNAANLVLLTSKREGSPNVIKESMACNRPIVVTDVGDVRKIIKNTKHCYIANDLREIREAMIQILNSNYITTNGRDKIAWLNEETIAKQIIEIYEKTTALK